MFAFQRKIRNKQILSYSTQNHGYDRTNLDRVNLVHISSISKRSVRLGPASRCLSTRLTSQHPTSFEASVQSSIVMGRDTRDEEVCQVEGNSWVHDSKSDLAVLVRWSHFLTGKSYQCPGRGCRYCRPQKWRGARTVASLRLSSDPKSDLMSPAFIPSMFSTALVLAMILLILSCGSEISILSLSHMKPRCSTVFNGVSANFAKFTPYLKFCRIYMIISTYSQHVCSSFACIKRSFM